MANLVSEIMEQAAIMIQNLLVMLIAWITSCFTGGQFSPSLGYLNALLKGDANNYAGSTMSLTTDVYNDPDCSNLAVILKFFCTVGIAVAIGILVFHICMIAFGHVMELKDNLFQLVLRFIIVLALMYEGPALLGVILDTGNTLFTYAGSQFGTGTMGNAGELLDPTLGMIDSVVSARDDMNETDDEESDDDDSFVSANGMPKESAAKKSFGEQLGIALLSPIIMIILFFVLTYQIIKLGIEMIKKYMTLMFLYLIFPLACSFMGSATTQNVFFSYIQMFVVEIGVLIFTKMWIALTLYFMARNVFSVILLLALLGFVAVGNQFENLFKSMGLSSANTGPALLDSISMTAGAMAMMGSKMAHGAGTVALNAGALTGATGLAAVGSGMLGKGIDSASVANAMNGSAGGQLRRHNAEKNPGTDNLTKGMRKNLNDNLARSGSFQNAGAFQNAYNNLSAAEKKGYWNGELGAGGRYANLGQAFSKNGTNLKPTGEFDKSLGAKVNLADKDGNVFGSGWISDKAMGNNSHQIENGDGTSSFLNVDDIDKNAANSISMMDSDGCPMPITGDGTSPQEIAHGVELSDYFRTNAEGQDDNIGSNYTISPIGLDGGCDIYHKNENGNELVGHMEPNGTAYVKGNMDFSGIKDEKTREATESSAREELERQFDGPSDEQNAGAFYSTGFKIDPSTFKCNSYGAMQVVATDTNSATNEKVLLNLSPASGDTADGKTSTFNGGRQFGTMKMRIDRNFAKDKKNSRKV